MERITITPANEADWLAMREHDVTSTEAAALFGCSPYATPYELWHRKTGQLEADFQVNQRMIWGNRLEAAIAYGIAEDHGLVVEPFKAYMRLPDVRMGSSFDFKVVGLVPGFAGQSVFRDLFEEHGPAVLEIKNVDGLAFKRGWINDDEKEAPPHIEFQVQHQLEVSGLGWAIIAPLVGGNTPVPFARLRDLATGNIIRQKVAAFWASIAAGTPPEPDFARDGKSIASLYLENNGKSIDLTGNNRLAELLEEYKAAAAMEKEGETRKDAAKAEILTIVGEYEKATLGDWKISAGTVKESKGTLILPEMVGTYLGGRRAYRNLRITAPK